MCRLWTKFEGKGRYGLAKVWHVVVLCFRFRYSTREILVNLVCFSFLSFTFWIFGLIRKQCDSGLNFWILCRDVSDRTDVSFVLSETYYNVCHLPGPPPFSFPTTFPLKTFWVFDSTNFWIAFASRKWSMHATRQLNISIFMHCCWVAETYANKIKCGRKNVVVAWYVGLRSLAPFFRKVQRNSGRKLETKNLLNLFWNMTVVKI